jgi:hypothetical protein
VPWEKLIRTISIPARIKLSIADLSSVAGPNVAMIFVRLRIVVASFIIKNQKNIGRAVQSSRFPVKMPKINLAIV